jgi:citronellol/citronellal dehydrogenase
MCSGDDLAADQWRRTTRDTSGRPSVLNFLEGKTALVTGASRGIGAAIAVALAACGADVAIAARTTAARPSRIPGTLENTAASIREFGRRALVIPADLSREEDVEAMVQATFDHFGRIDVAVNNAAVASPGDLDLDRKHFELLMSINVRAPMVAIRALRPIMEQGGEGRIVNISSATAAYVVPGLMGYGMSKVALEHLTVSSAVMLAPSRIAVNCFRVDIGTASEGIVYRTSGRGADGEPPSVPAEGVIWMLRQDLDYTGHLVSMAALRTREGIMESQAPNAAGTPFPLIFPGLEQSL